MDRLQDITEAVVSADAELVADLVREALATGTAPRDIIDDGLIPAMADVGDMFEAKEIFVPELYMAAQSMVSGLDILEPLLGNKDLDGTGTVVIGTVRGDLHDIGKNLVALMFQGAGFKVIDLGVNVAPVAFVDAVRQERPDVVCLSSLLTTTMPSMEATLDALSEAGIRDQVTVLVGGAPVTERFAHDIGADGYADNCSAAVMVAKGLLGARDLR